MLTTRLRAPVPPADAAGRPVLVAVRDSSTRNPSIKWAARRAHASGSPLTLVHAVPGADLLPPGTRNADIIAAGRLLLRSGESSLSTSFPELRVSTCLHRGDVVHALLGLSADSSLLVVGADRVNGAGGAYEGSVALQVALGSAAPVVVIPPDHRESRRGESGPSHIVVGVDGSAASYAALAWAAAEADRTGMTLRVIAAITPAAPGSEALMAGTAALLLDIHAGYPSLGVSLIVDVLRTPSRALTRHSRNAALLVVGRHGRGARRAMALGSVTHALLLRPPCPTLVVPGPRPGDGLPVTITEQHRVQHPEPMPVP